MTTEGKVEEMSGARDTAKQLYDKYTEGEPITDPVEALRFFCAQAMSGQDWIDVESFFDDITNTIASHDLELSRERQSRQSAQEQLERYKAEVTRLEHLLSAAKKDANRYRWLSSNSKHIKWIPSNYNKDVVSGFSAFSTGYLGFGFEEAIDAAIAAQEMK